MKAEAKKYFQEVTGLSPDAGNYKLSSEDILYLMVGFCKSQKEKEVKPKQKTK